MLVRTQNCSAFVGGSCVYCSGAGSNASVLTFAELLSGGAAGTPPVFQNVSQSSLVFGPGNGTFDDFGVGAFIIADTAVL